MMEFTITMLLFGFSVTTTVVNGSIFDSLRNWALVKAPAIGKLLSCIMCFGFWIGVLIFYPLNFLGFLEPIGKMPIWFNYIFYPFIQSTTGMVLESLIIFFRKQQ